MFCATLKLPVETPEQTFIPPADFDYTSLFSEFLAIKDLLI
ncbi:hypothetical protein Tco_1371010, partial [Tanacetum coccineum]